MGTIYQALVIEDMFQEYVAGTRTWQSFLDEAYIWGYESQNKDDSANVDDFVATKPYYPMGGWHKDKVGGLGELYATDFAAAFRNFVHYLSTSHIKVECRSVFAGLLTEDGLNTEAFTKFLSEKNACYDADPYTISNLLYDNNNEAWGSCRGTASYSNRGKTCGTWTLLHALTVNRESTSELTVQQSITVIGEMIATFYGIFACDICRMNFIQKLEDTVPYDANTYANDIEYIWYVHNKANSDIGAEEDRMPGGDRDPYYPKDQWPPTSLCALCMSDDQVAVEFLKVFYSGESDEVVAEGLKRFTSDDADPTEPYVLVDGGHCPEGMNLMDGEECSQAAESMDLLYLAKYEEKTTRAGCFYAPGFSNGVYFNSHPEAPHMDDNEYSSICRLDLRVPLFVF